MHTKDREKREQKSLKLIGFDELMRSADLVQFPYWCLVYKYYLPSWIHCCLVERQWKIESSEPLTQIEGNAMECKAALSFSSGVEKSNWSQTVKQRGQTRRQQREKTERTDKKTGFLQRQKWEEGMNGWPAEIEIHMDIFSMCLFMVHKSVTPVERWFRCASGISCEWTPLLWLYLPPTFIS